VAIETISTLQELPPLDGVGCDLTPEEIAKKSVDRFNKLATVKFMAGQAEHGGNLVNKVRLENAEEEIIDLWFYIQALRLRLGK
jgi:hypothetical protein